MKLIPIVSSSLAKPTKAQVEAMLYTREFKVREYLSALESLPNKNQVLSQSSITYQQLLNTVNSLVALSKISRQLALSVIDSFDDLEEDRVLTEAEITRFMIASKVLELTDGSN